MRRHSVTISSFSPGSALIKSSLVTFGRSLASMKVEWNDVPWTVISVFRRGKESGSSYGACFNTLVSIDTRSGALARHWNVPGGARFRWSWEISPQMFTREIALRWNVTDQQQQEAVSCQEANVAWRPLDQLWQLQMATAQSQIVSALCWNNSLSFTPCRSAVVLISSAGSLLI